MVLDITLKKDKKERKIINQKIEKNKNRIKKIEKEDIRKKRKGRKGK